MRQMNRPVQSLHKPTLILKAGHGSVLICLGAGLSIACIHAQSASGMCVGSFSSLPKYTPSQVTRCLKADCQAYMDLANAYTADPATKLEETAAKHQQLFETVSPCCSTQLAKQEGHSSFRAAPWYHPQPDKPFSANQLSLSGMPMVEGLRDAHLLLHVAGTPSEDNDTSSQQHLQSVASALSSLAWVHHAETLSH